VKQDFTALVIDDEPQVCRSLADFLISTGWQVSEVNSAEQAFEKMAEQQWKLVFCDVVLGGTDGYEVLRRFTEKQPEAKFVLMTGYESAAGALDAIAGGAYDYVVKPFNLSDISSLAESVRKQLLLRMKPNQSKTKSKSSGYVSDIPLIGRSPAFLECLKTVGRVAATVLPVLITGESGTGKEVVAQSIHQRSNRRAEPFITVNCGAIPVELIESELFGHVKGAFTGAERDRLGLWEEANGGTIFLDEITETNPLFQVKLLRALQSGEIRRVGSNRTSIVDVRVIAATNRNIKEEVRQGRFRQDLMYRLNAITINLPPLRERLEDIPLLAEYFAGKYQLPDNTPATFSHEALEMLKSYNWEGNVRELENAVLHSVSMCDRIIYPEHLPEPLQHYNESTAYDSISGEVSQDDLPLTSNKPNSEWLTLSEMEAKYALRVLVHTAGNKQAAARLLGIDYKTLTRIIKRHGIKP
jgi:DNA-binding NtrC family response regulator